MESSGAGIGERARPAACGAHCSSVVRIRLNRISVGIQRITCWLQQTAADLQSRGRPGRWCWMRRSHGISFVKWNLDSVFFQILWCAFPPKIGEGVAQFKIQKFILLTFGFLSLNLKVHIKVALLTRFRLWFVRMLGGLDYCTLFFSWCPKPVLFSTRCASPLSGDASAASPPAAAGGSAAPEAPPKDKRDRVQHPARI